MPTCFVIQPFDNGKFDTRYREIYKPAIENAGLIPYRVDNDPAVRIAIDEIEKNILDSAICFAEITIDNPNVWYELGFAFASKKDVVMVSEENRVGGFPFDVRHRIIITYGTETPSSYKRLETAITAKINALRETNKEVNKIIASPIPDQLGLKGHEIAILRIVMQNQFTDEDSYSIYSLKSEMQKAGYDDFDTNVGLRMLKVKQMVTVGMEESGWNNEIYPHCKITESGISWVIANQDKVGSKNTKNKVSNNEPDDSDGLPF